MFITYKVGRQPAVFLNNFKMRLKMESSIAQTMVSKTSIRMSNIGTYWWVVDEGGGGRDDSGRSSNDSSISLTPLSLSWSISSSDKSKMSSLGLCNFWGVLDWLWCNTSVNWGNKRLRVECRSNKRLWVEGRSNRKTRVSNTESGSISNILNLLELSIGVDIRVSSRNSAIGVSDNMSIRVDVSITVVQVSEFILSVELASSSVRSISSIGW